MTPTIRLFSSDLDGTLLGNPESTARFREAWLQLPQDARPILVYNSGRLVPDIQRLVASGVLPQADYLIGGVGTQIHDIRSASPVEEFESHLTGGWDRERVDAVLAAEPGVRPQPPELQHRYKSSWFLERASRRRLRDLHERLRTAGLEVHVVYSSDRDLDVLPLNASKGGALAWLCARLGIPLTEVLVAGDTGNDASMFRLPGVRGIIVENALPELYEATVEIPVYSSREILADGVLDGLCHHRVVCSPPPRAKTAIPRGADGPRIPDAFFRNEAGRAGAGRESADP